MNCPYQTHFDKKGMPILYECPQHNKKGGCALWMSYSVSEKDEATQIETTRDVPGCAHTITPMLLLENTNGLLLVAQKTNQVSSEVSALRVENIREQQANRTQFIALAQGHTQLIQADHISTHKGIPT